MRIGIEAERANNPVKTGVEHYAKELILEMSKQDSEDEFVLYLRTEPQDWIKQLPKNFKYKVMPFPIFWTQIRVSLEMLLHPPDVLFIPASSMPIIHPRKTVVTVHDLAFMYFPDTYTWFQRNFHKFEDILVRLFAWKIIAVSESTKKDFLKFWGGSESKIKVVHHGYSEASDQGQVTSDELKQRLPEKYILFLSTLQPRKNLPGLIEAFKLLKKEHPELPHKLVVIGKAGWKPEESLKAIEDNKDIVEYLGHVSDSDRFEAMRKADALVLPSFYEGFGMQILEAFDAGAPVVTSQNSSLSEVAGDAAEFCDPLDVQSIKKAILQVLEDPQYADSLKVKGRERLRGFSWRKCAEETLRVFR